MTTNRKQTYLFFALFRTLPFSLGYILLLCLTPAHFTSRLAHRTPHTQRIRPQVKSPRCSTQE